MRLQKREQMLKLILDAVILEVEGFLECPKQARSGSGKLACKREDAQGVLAQPHVLQLLRQSCSRTCRGHHCPRRDGHVRRSFSGLFCLLFGRPQKDGREEGTKEHHDHPDEEAIDGEGRGRRLCRQAEGRMSQRATNCSIHDMLPPSLYCQFGCREDIILLKVCLRSSADHLCGCAPAFPNRVLLVSHLPLIMIEVKSRILHLLAI
mmetsp:Transcript_33341/g.76868  ORF Transcript_33341/g.76868 Transcript_33341/m.76868 type:complete len:207 (-) Transcript_33341:125-745(-)